MTQRNLNIDLKPPKSRAALINVHVVPNIGEKSRVATCAHFNWHDLALIERAIRAFGQLLKIYEILHVYLRCEDVSLQA